MLLPLAGVQGQFYEAEQDEYQAPNAGQKNTVQNLERRLLDLGRRIQGYYTVLRATGLVSEAGSTRIPLTAEQQNFYGQYDKRYVYNEVAYIHWSDDKIRYFFFEQRRSHRRRPQVLLKRWYGRPIGDRATATPANPGGFQGYALDVVMRRIDTYEGSTYVNHRLFTGRDLRDIDPDTQLPANSGEQVRDLPRLYVNRIARRIKFLREYRQLMELLERRIDRHVRDAKNRSRTKFDLLKQALP